MIIYLVLNLEQANWLIQGAKLVKFLKNTEGSAKQKNIVLQVEAKRCFFIIKDFKSN
jgi:hypothetical protein